MKNKKFYLFVVMIAFVLIGAKCNYYNQPTEGELKEKAIKEIKEMMKDDNEEMMEDQDMDIMNEEAEDMMDDGEKMMKDDNEESKEDSDKIMSSEKSMTDDSDKDMMESSTKTFNITGKKFEFSQKEIKVKKGDKVVVNFENTDGFHNWGIDEFGARTKNLNVGEKDTVSFTANKSGTFVYYCSVDGHRDFGMTGKLIVE